MYRDIFYYNTPIYREILLKFLQFTEKYYVKRTTFHFRRRAETVLRRAARLSKPPELFCRKIGPWKFRKFPRKTAVLESLFNSVAGRNFICEKLLLFVSLPNIITNSSGEFGLDETSTECEVSIFKTYRSSRPEVFCKKRCS